MASRRNLPRKGLTSFTPSRPTCGTEIWPTTDLIIGDDMAHGIKKQN